MTVIERLGADFTHYQLPVISVRDGVVACNAATILDPSRITPDKLFGGVYSNVVTVAGGNLTFNVPPHQTQTATEPASGRYMCLIADNYHHSGETNSDNTPELLMTLKFQSLTSLLKIPVVGLPASERLTSVKIQALNDEKPFMNTLCLKAVHGEGELFLGATPTGDWYSDTITVELDTPSATETVFTASIMPRYLIECALQGTKPAKKNVYFDVIFTTIDASSKSAEYPFNGCSMDISGWSFDASQTLNDNGSAFDIIENAPLTATITITGAQRQLLRFGVDAERLWYYWPNQRDRLAEMAVKELKADYVRVAINAAYEREEGNINLGAYTDDIIPLMTKLKSYNPNIKFYASVRPLKEAYDTNNNPADAAFVNQNFKNGNIAMFAYPLWVGGHKNVLIEPFKAFKKENMVRYLADYLNLMKSYGFDLEYMDLVNEEQDIWENEISNIIYVIEQLPLHLHSGVQMPKIIFPSTWSPGDGFKKFLDVSSVKANQSAVLAKLDVVATHNTPDTGIHNFDETNLVQFADAIHKIDPNKEVWNTEAHGWVGINAPVTEMRNSAIFFKHIRAGYTGFETWLFFGSWAGNDHSMVYSNNSNAPVTTTKFEIYKTVVNEMNLGHHIGSDCDNSALTQVVMRKENKMMLCIQNLTDKSYEVNVNMPAGTTIAGTISCTRWEESMKNVVGIKGSDITPKTSTLFSATVPQGSLLCCLFHVNGPM